MLSKAQEEEMSSALIAQLLAEDAMDQGGGDHDYYNEYSNDTRHQDSYRTRHYDKDDSYSEPSDDEYAPKRKAAKQKKANGKKEMRGRKRKAEPKESASTATTTKAAEASSVEPEAKSDDKAAKDDATKANGTDTPAPASASTEPAKPQLTVKGQPSKKPRKAIPPGMNTGVYTEEEEKLFLEALNLYGRGWQDLSRHMGTRDPHSIRSHAQKYFIRLYRDNLPLPPKVAESGEGYTLSGKPLDPNSAAAKPYLQAAAAGHARRPSAEGDGSNAEAMALNAHGIPSHLASAKAAAKPKAESKPKKETPKKEKKEKKETKSRSHSPDVRDPLYESVGRTTYASARLRQKREDTKDTRDAEDEFTLVKCEHFSGTPGSDERGAQPFSLTVHSNVLLTMDFHAHLMNTEIIGFLGGKWDRATRRIEVKEAFPCRSLKSDHDDINVEMDPTSALETRHLIEERDMQVVGWYHSHPVFNPDPSHVDIENQCNYQQLCRDEAHDQDSKTIEPFVGAIVGPYDPRLPASASVVNWFHCDMKRRIPMGLVYNLQEDECLPTYLQERLLELPAMYKESPDRVNFAERWRQSGEETKLAKLIKSLGSRMPWVQKKLKEQFERMEIKQDDDEIVQEIDQQEKMEVDADTAAHEEELDASKPAEAHQEADEMQVDTDVPVANGQDVKQGENGATAETNVTSEAAMVADTDKDGETMQMDVNNSHDDKVQEKQEKQEEQETQAEQNNNGAAPLQDSVDDMQIGDQPACDANDKDNLQARETSPVLDTFLEKVQQILQAW
ncbi:hypothetical protein BC940DRAFT_298307 [Gongronella butleri]|nr:hypothetical protein BC940DRAFT_298307 [Gongronella butleri]